jgi:hypothetical protein
MRKFVGILGMFVVASSLAKPPDLRRLSIGDGTEWLFLNGEWRDGEEGALVPPEGGGREYIALWKKTAYSNVTAHFRFRFRKPFGGARLLFRVQDSTHYYALDIPWCGQQNRNRHMWAGIVVADGTPLQRYLHFALIPGVPPEHNRWYEARVEASGPRIRAWVEGRLIADLEDSTYSSGRVGLMGLITAKEPDAAFRGPGSSGQNGCGFAPGGIEDPATALDYALSPSGSRHLSELSKPDPKQSGILTASIPFGNPNRGEIRGSVWVRSSDDGRTWSELARPALAEGFGAAFVRHNGAWVTVHCKSDGPPQQALYTFESNDEGKSWSGAKPFRLMGEWPKELTAPFYTSGQVLRLRNGVLLLSIYAQVVDFPHTEKASTNYIFRSTDDGDTWSAPIRCDRNNSTDQKQGWFSPGNFSEVGLAEAAADVVVGLGRPGSSPLMWQLQSNDGGLHWEPAAFAPFPGYCISLTRTASGALIAITRFPYLAAHVSWDGGKNWDDGTILDYPLWANHKAVEVAPDVVLVIYMGHIVEKGQADDRVLRLRVTKSGLRLDQ